MRKSRFEKFGSDNTSYGYRTKRDSGAEFGMRSNEPTDLVSDSKLSFPKTPDVESLRLRLSSIIATKIPLSRNKINREPIPPYNETLYLRPRSRSFSEVENVL